VARRWVPATIGEDLDVCVDWLGHPKRMAGDENHRRLRGRGSFLVSVTTELEVWRDPQLYAAEERISRVSIMGMGDVRLSF